MFKYGGGAFLAVALLSACGSNEPNLVDSTVKSEPEVNRELTDTETKESVSVVSKDVLGPLKKSEVGESLVVGIPTQWLGKEYYFGGVITKIGLGTDPKLGILKFASSRNFRIKLSLSSGKLSIDSPKFGKSLISLPIIKTENNRLFVSFEELGKGLNLFNQMDPSGRRTGYFSPKSKTSQVRLFSGALKFDVKSDIMNMFDPSIKSSITTSWYLKKVKGKRLEERKNVEGLRFFTSNRNPDATIQRFDISKPVLYYAKNFPEDLKPSVTKAIEQWNNAFEKNVGKRPFKLRFADAGTQLYKMVKTGDIGLNVIEWDNTVVAPYLGFGPCVKADDGKNLACGALIQGPKLVAAVSRAFERKTFEDSLGMVPMRDQHLHFDTSNMKVNIAGLDFTLNALNEEISDHAHGDDWFETLGVKNSGKTPLQYLKDLVTGVIAHEVGHNIGLRHNFKGSIFANENRKSSSVMDYLFSSDASNMKVEEHDEMAIAYGYKGIAPYRTDMFCTDGQNYSLSNTKNSIECQVFDSGSDPYVFYRDSLMDAMIKADDSTRLGEDGVRIHFGKLQFAVNGLAGYLNNFLHGLSVTNFNSIESLSSKKRAEFVQEELRQAYCLMSESIQSAEESSPSSTEQKRWDSLYKYVVLGSGLTSPSEFNCPMLAGIGLNSKLLVGSSF
ncbi:MAG: zinc-dependent metalloprotease [Bdellovibrionales bacterium]